MDRRRPPDTYFTLIALVALQVAVVALPGGPFFNTNPVAIAIGVLALILLGRGSRTAWWLTTVLAGLSAAGALANPFVGPEGGPIAGIDRLDTAIWLVSIVAIFVVLVGPSMRAYVRSSATRPA
jgi:hypothetical protein